MSMEVEDEEVVSPRADLIAAVLWVAFGLAVSIGSWRMDRLEKLSINPYEVPGLVPFFLGCAITVLGLVLLIRAWAQGGCHTSCHSGCGAARRPSTGALSASGVLPSVGVLGVL